jgi:hypothetical protein
MTNVSPEMFVSPVIGVPDMTQEAVLELKPESAPPLAALPYQMLGGEEYSLVLAV